MSDTAILEKRVFYQGPADPLVVRPSVTKAEFRDIQVPAIRVPVTPANRSRLRELRARELDVWGDAVREPSYLATPPADREAQAIYVVLAAAALATAVQTTSVITTFVENWDRFRQLVTTLIQ